MNVERASCSRCRGFVAGMSILCTMLTRTRPTSTSTPRPLLSLTYLAGPAEGGGDLVVAVALRLRQTRRARHRHHRAALRRVVRRDRVGLRALVILLWNTCGGSLLSLTAHVGGDVREMRSVQRRGRQGGVRDDGAAGFTPRATRGALFLTTAASPTRHDAERTAPV